MEKRIMNQYENQSLQHISGAFSTGESWGAKHSASHVPGHWTWGGCFGTDMAS